MEIDWFPLWLSLEVAAGATAISLALGLWLAWLLVNRQFAGKDVLDALTTLPLALPPTVLGYYLLIVIGRNSWIGEAWGALTGSPLVFTWRAAVIASTLHAIPLVVKSSRAALESIDRDCERAGRSLGASEARIFFRISLPFGATPGDGGHGAGIRTIFGGFRGNADDCGRYSGADADGGDRDLRCGGIRQYARGDGAGACDFGGDGRDCISVEPAGASARRMIQFAIAKQFPKGPESAGFQLDIAFEVERGVTVLYGPSGSGKTLTLDAIAGFVTPSAGRIMLDGRILFDAGAKVNLPPQQRSCGYVFQNEALFPHMTLRQNLAFAAHDLPRLERHRAIGEMLERFRVAELAGALSGGTVGRAEAAGVDCAGIDCASEDDSAGRAGARAGYGSEGGVAGGDSGVEGVADGSGPDGDARSGGVFRAGGPGAGGGGREDCASGGAA